MFMFTMVFFLLGFGDACNECEILSWTDWMVCANESICNTGDIIRKAGICCQLNSPQQCLSRCNLTDSDVIIKGNGTSNASQLSRNKEQDESGTGGGVIAGAIVGVLAVAGLSGLLAFFLYRRWKKNKEERKVEPKGNGGEDPVSQKPPVSTSLN